MVLPQVQPSGSTADPVLPALAAALDEGMIGVEQTRTIVATIKGLPADVNPGDFLLIDDGKVRVQVVSVDGPVVTTEVIVAGPVSRVRKCEARGAALSPLIHRRRPRAGSVCRTESRKDGTRRPVAITCQSCPHRSRTTSR